MGFRLFCTFLFILVPTAAFAWGPMTHVYLGTEVFYLGSLLPAAVYGLLRRYKQDFLYGNFMADIILAKKYLPAGRSSHCWDVALSMLDSADQPSERAFCLGYMSHLAADTVAHNSYTAGRRNVEHTLLELRADRSLDIGYWYQAIAIGKKVQRRNDSFMEKSLERVIFSFNTNKRIYKSMVALSFLNKELFTGRMARGFVSAKKHHSYIESLRRDSLDRIVDVLQNGERSDVLRKDPRGGVVRRGRVFNAFLN